MSRLYRILEPDNRAFPKASPDPTADPLPDAASTRREPAGSTVADDERLSPEAQDDAITRIMSTAYEEESWRRVMNACMIAAGALVVRPVLPAEQFRTLFAPFARL